LKIGSKILTKVAIMFVSPAQGAMFAPLALKFVRSGPSIFSFLTMTPHRVPIQTIDANWTATKTDLPSPKKRNRNVGPIVGGTIGGVAAIFAVIGIVTCVRRRRRWRSSRRRSIFSTDFADASPQIIASPFYSDSFDANRESGISTERQPSVIGDPEAEMVALHRLSPSPPAVLPLLGQVAPVPVGLSDKKMAQLRAEALSSPQRHNFRISASNMSQSASSLNAVTESRESPFDTQRLHSEFESLRREVERLREEGLTVAAPPSYAEGDR
jgi:hypothetical protein